MTDLLIAIPDSRPASEISFWFRIPLELKNSDPLLRLCNDVHVDFENNPASKLRYKVSDPVLLSTDQLHYPPVSISPDHSEEIIRHVNSRRNSLYRAPKASLSHYHENCARCRMHPIDRKSRKSRRFRSKILALRRSRWCSPFPCYSRCRI